LDCLVQEPRIRKLNLASSTEQSIIPFNNLKIKQRSSLTLLVLRGSNLVKDNNGE